MITPPPPTIGRSMPRPCSFNGIVRIGQIDGDVSVLRGWAKARSVTLELAD